MPLRLIPHKPSRVLIKDPLACLLSEYLVRRHGFHALVVFRHPAAVVASFQRMKWPSGRYVARFLEDERLLNEGLASHAARLERVVARDDVESAAVLHGCIYTVLWRFTERNYAMRRLVFEELARDPLRRFQELCGELALPYDEGTRAIHERLCFHPTPQDDAYRPHDVRRSSMEMVARWRDELSSTELVTIRGVWDSFDVPLYRGAEEWAV